MESILNSLSTLRIISLIVIIIIILLFKGRYTIVGSFLISRRKYKKGIEYFQKKLKKFPNKTKILNGFGYCNFMIGNFIEAERYYVDSLAIKPNKLNENVELGLCYIELKKYSKAKRIFFHVEELNRSGGFFNKIASEFLQEILIWFDFNCSTKNSPLPIDKYSV